MKTRDTDSTANHSTPADFDQQLRDSLDQQAEHIDLRSQMRLNAARDAALSAVQTNATKHPQAKPAVNAQPGSKWLLGASFASMALVGVLLLNATLFRDENTAAALTAQDVDILAADESLEFYDDIDLLMLLSAQDENRPLNPAANNG